MKRLKEIIMLIPFVMLLADGIALFLYDEPYYQTLSLYFLNQITGHTILGLIFMYFYAYIHRFCLYSKISIIGMAFLNLYNICFSVFGLSDYFTYAQILILTAIVLSSIFLIKKLL